MMYPIHLSLWLIATLLGPVGYLITKYTGKLDSIYGNNVDGLCGDITYRDNEAMKLPRSLFPCFWWSVIRNPANNLARGFRSGLVSDVKRGTIFHTAKINGATTWFLYTTTWPVLIKLGYKMWDDIEDGKYYEAKLAFSIQRSKRSTTE